MLLSKKYFKYSIICLLITSFLLQSIPITVKAVDILDTIRKWVKGISVPDELKLTESGDIKLGNNVLFKCIYKYDKDGDGKKEECVNPFSTIKLGSDQTSLTDATGKIQIPETNLPEICELRIVPPPEQEALSQEERLALSKACSDLAKIQREASNTVYFAKKMFNATDPFSDCLFLRNCKTSCSLSFGKISYTISIFDIAEMFLPLGWVHTLQKIANFASKVQEITNIVSTIKETISLGINFFNGFLKNTAYISTFFSSLSNLLEINSAEDFRNMLADYSDNLFKFSQAKSEAQNLILATQSEALSAINKIENEKGVSFLFDGNDASVEKRNSLENLVYTYLSFVGSPTQTAELLAKNSEFLNGYFDDSGNPKKKAGLVECPEEKLDSCFVSKSTIPQDCSVKHIGNENVLLFCQAKSGEISCEKTDNLPKKYSFTFPNGQNRSFECDQDTNKQKEFMPSGWQEASNSCYMNCNDAENCDFSCLAERNCLAEWSSGQNKGVFHCPATNINIPFPQTFGIHTLSSPALTGEIEITCPATCPVTCIEPLSDWFEEFKYSWRQSQTLYPIISYFTSSGLGAGRLEDFESIKKWFSSLGIGKKLILDSQAFLPNLRDEGIKYWLEKDFSLFANNIEEANNQSKNNCKFDYNLVYFDWTKKINVIKQSQFNLITQGLNGFSTETYDGEKAKEFLLTPIINYQIIEIMDKLTGDNALNFKNDLEQLKEEFSGLNKTWFSNKKDSLYALVSDIVEVKRRSKNIISIINNGKADFETIKSALIPLDAVLIEKSIFIDVKNLVEEFLNDLSKFEKEKTFEELKGFLLAIDELKKIIENFILIQEQVTQIKPTLEIPTLQLSGDVNDIGSLKFSSAGDTVDTFEQFKEKFGQNPLSYLKKYFDAAKVYLENSEARLSSIGLNLIKDEVSSLLDNCEILKRTIIGDEEMESGCIALSPIFKQTPKEIEISCESLDISLINDKPLNDKCADRISLTANLAINNVFVEDFLKMSDLRSWWMEKVCSQFSPFKGGKTYPDWVSCKALAVRLKTDFVKEIMADELKESCNSLQYQKDLKPECEYFENLKNALKNNCLGNTDCKKIRTEMANLWSGTIFDLTKNEYQGTSTEAFENANLDKIKSSCELELSDLKTPLREVMNVYSVLLAIKSGTLAYKGIKTSYEDAKMVYQSSQRVISMIKNLPERLKERSDKKMLDGGFDIELLKCVTNPATGYNGQTDIKGGKVCPNVDYLFSIVESNFSIMRDDLKHIDMVRRRKEWIQVNAGNVHVGLLAKYPIKYSSINEIYNEAENIKSRTQDLWALATAVNFAAENCTCGQSYCKLPLCISGVPLTFAPLSEAYCYLTFILRHPMLKQIQALENYLE